MPATPRILVIGARGFVGRHLVALLEKEHGPDAVIATGRDGEADQRRLDIRDTDMTRVALEEIRPTHVVNLAGLAAPAEARRLESAAWELHVHAPLALGRLLGETCPEAWLLHVGSGLAYGRQALHGAPVRETEPLEPMDPYGATKAAGDIAVGALASEGIRVVRLRPFNHTGPGQSEDFAIPAFAAQIARIEAGQSAPVLSVGNLEAARDFLHVSDVVHAYAALIRASDKLVSGDIYNVASGTPQVMRTLLERLLTLSTARIEIRTDPARQRASDLPTIAGAATRLEERTGWRPRIGCDEMLSDVLRDCRSRTR
ncbi:NAD-dependent epimerase/dehydratase family protein [Palleronia abyssalis]|uniref:GDP-6-deoxy-D-mannose reductase n=1 Tax=Palleronia abyssalis TaxID=1501240 RepID=A0A2R8BZF0_9RHOB|nr:NAD-dependent epimerase/dehydratase family protein [Palleronia abyssalis]SPJ25499.1 GDP-6-deoxy-D-mannose reductase [Palleronia abyssalis]